MYEYRVISAPPRRTKLGFLKNDRRRMRELNDLLNSMSGDHWEYMGDRDNGNQMVFARIVQSLEDGLPPKVRPIRQAKLEKPIVVRRIRPEPLEFSPLPEFKTQQDQEIEQTQIHTDAEKVVAFGGQP